jgi:hypothetical protein
MISDQLISNDFTFVVRFRNNDTINKCRVKLALITIVGATYSNYGKCYQSDDKLDTA